MVLRRNGVVRCALEHEELRGAGSDVRNGLDRGRAGANDGDALASEVDALVRPAAGMEGATGEGLAARHFRHVRGRETACRHDAVTGAHPAAVVGRDAPPTRTLVERRRRDARVQLDVAAEIEAIGDVLEVAQDLGLRRIALGPFPLLLELRRELIRVLHALDVAARAWVAIPEPGAADAAAGLEDAGRESELAQTMQHAEAGEAGAHDDGVDVGGLWIIGHG